MTLTIDTTSAGAELARIRRAADQLNTAALAFSKAIGGRAARLIREAYPDAAVIGFGVESSGGDETLYPLYLLDTAGTVLWDDDEAPRPDILEKDGTVVALLCDLVNHGAGSYLDRPDDRPGQDFEGDVYALDLAAALTAAPAEERPVGYITLATLRGILARETSVIDPDDVDVLMTVVTAEAATVNARPAGHRVEADGHLADLRRAVDGYEATDNPASQNEYGIDGLHAAAELDRLLSGGASKPAAWVDNNADGILPALLEGSRAETDRAHAMHDAASDEVDRLRVELREQLDAKGNVKPDKWTVVGVWDNCTPVPVAVIAGDHQVQGGDEYHFSEQGLWGTCVTAADAAEAEGLAVEEMLATHDEDDEDECRREGCDESTEDGEGYDGDCGTHADMAEALLDAGQHPDEMTAEELEAASDALRRA